MLKRRLCQAEFSWTLTCDGPLLTRDERYTKLMREKYNEVWKKDKGFSDCISLSHLSEQEIESRAGEVQAGSPRFPFFFPGTSLRGPFRAQAERIIRTLAPDASLEDLPLKTACDPFISGQEDAGGGRIGAERQKYQSCSKRLENKQGIPYKLACPACKLFGFAGLASRIAFADADIDAGYHSVYRDMVGIDRFTGGAFQEKTADGKSKGALMRFHVLENASFSTKVTVVNFELWHLGLLAYVFRDFQEGLVPLGFGKTKGFGLVKGEVTEVTLAYPRTVAPGKIEHLGSLMPAKETGVYGVAAVEAPPLEGLKEKAGDTLSLFKTFSLKPQDLALFWQKTAEAFNSYVDNLKPKPDQTEGIKP